MTEDLLTRRLIRTREQARSRVGRYIAGADRSLSATIPALVECAGGADPTTA